MERFRILIVDDEPYIVEELARLVGERFRKEAVLRYSDSGGAALKLLREEPCDILLSDIQMPGVNGFELARACRETVPDAKIVFLSGYDQFAYAREAIRLEAYDYVLKNEDDDHLLQVLSRAMEELGREREVSRESRQLQEQLRRYLLMELLQGKPLVLTDREQEELQLQEPLFIAAMVPDGSAPPAIGREDARAVELDGLLAPYCEWMVWIRFPLHSALVARVREADEERFLRQAALAAERVLTGWRRDEWRKVCLTELGREYQAACGRLGQASQAAPEEAEPERGAYLQELLCDSQAVWNEAEIYRLRQLIESCETGIALRMPKIAGDAADTLCDALFQTSPANRRYASELCGQFATMLQHQLNVSRLGLSPGQDIFSAVMGGINKESDAARARVRETISALAAMPAPARHGQEQTVLQVKQLVDVFLTENISVAQLAALLNYSEAHLNRVFRRAEGVSVHTYISKRKLETAQKLLETTQMRIGAIGALCGFETASYFVRFFKKTAGVTPQQYRQQHLMGKQPEG